MAKVTGLCFWCDGETGETVRTVDEGEDRRCVISYRGCQKCEEAWKERIVFIEVSEQPYAPGQPSLKQDELLYPSGDYTTLAPADVDQLFTEKAAIRYKRDRKVVVPTNLYQQLFGGVDVDAHAPDQQASSESPTKH